MEARGGIEPPMRVLQTLALPLGHRAIFLVSYMAAGREGNRIIARLQNRLAQHWPDERRNSPDTTKVVNGRLLRALPAAR